jgi:SDR family mycofactocin-dependent oxidoreductase
MKTLTGKVALVTGASRAQGRAHALTLAAHGADLVICDIGRDMPGLRYSLGSEDELADTADHVRALGRRVICQTADVRSQEQIDDVVGAAMSAFGRVDIAIANAGVFHSAPLWMMAESEWTTVVDTNLGGVWRTAKSVIPHMLEAGQGDIVMISSVNGTEPATRWAAYAASKAGVIGLMQSTALELAKYGIRCNAICPGFVRSGMTTSQDALDRYAGRSGATEDVLVSAGLSFHPLRDLSYLEPQAIADAALWLVSPAAGAVTGIALTVDAGHVLVPGRVTRSATPQTR